MFMVTMLGCGEVGTSDGVPMGGALPGGASIFPRTTTFRDQRYVHVVRQEYDFSCGSAVVATILKYAYDRDLSEQQVFRGMYAVSNPALVRERGFSLLDMKNYVETLGMHAVGYRIQRQALYQVKVPVIVLLNIGGYEHFVVMRKATPSGFYVADPALGNRTMTKEGFDRDWQYGIIFAIIGKDYNPNNPLVSLEKPLSPADVARGLVPAFNPVNEQILSGITVNTGIPVTPRL